MESDLDTRLHDHVALAEIELYAEVLTAVAAVDHRLSHEELDRALGLGTVPGPEPPPPPTRNHRHRTRSSRRTSR